jgi:hypothetical protein
VRRETWGEIACALHTLISSRRCLSTIPISSLMDLGELQMAFNKLGKNDLSHKLRELKA